MNIYEMYIANNNKTGFYIIRDSWGYTYAQVIKIQGKTKGKLIGRHPYYGNPVVLMNVYKYPSEILQCKLKEVSCPGTGGYTMFPSEEEVLSLLKQRNSRKLI